MRCRNFAGLQWSSSEQPRVAALSPRGARHSVGLRSGYCAACCDQSGLRIVRSVSIESCFICDKHRQGASAEGGIIFEDDLVYAGHVHRRDERDAYLGYLVAEPKRHVAGLGDLTADEAGALGRLVNDLARVLRTSEGAEHIYSFVFGDGAVSYNRKLWIAGLFEGAAYLPA